MQRVLDNVLMLTKEKPNVKNNYQALIVEYWKRFDAVTKLEDAPVAATSAESITRAFRKLVSDGKVLVNPNTHSARGEKQVEYHEFYSPVPVRRCPIMRGGV